MVLLASTCGAALVGGTGGPAPSSGQGSTVPHKPAHGQPYLWDSEAMGLGMGLSFAAWLATGVWQSWERRRKG